jgi:DNA polymerase-1
MEKAGFPIVKYTATGNPSWDADALEMLEIQGHPLAKDIADIRKASNKISKFFEPWTTKLGEDGRLHPSFNPMRVDDKWAKEVGTSTGRLSSSNPNAQQIAKEETPCFGGEEGWLFGVLDYSQIELRILAWLGHIDNVLQAYEEGQDLHILMAAKVAGVDPSEVTPDMRQSGKAGNFGFAYDMGEQTYVEYARKNYRVNVTLAEARKIRKAFFNDQWVGLRKYHERQRTLVHRYGYVRNPLGRKRRLPEVYSGRDYEIGRAERRAINAPTQSMASDLMCLSLIEIDRVIDPTQVRLVGTVHDSLLAQFRADTLDENLERVARIMLDPGTEQRFGVRVGVPLEVEAKIGYHWNSDNAETRTYRAGEVLVKGK